MYYLVIGNVSDDYLSGFYTPYVHLSTGKVKICSFCFVLISELLLYSNCAAYSWW